MALGCEHPEERNDGIDRAVWVQRIEENFVFWSVCCGHGTSSPSWPCDVSVCHGSLWLP